MEWILKNNTNEFIYKTDSNLWSPKGKGRRSGMNQEYEINRYILLYIKQIIVLVTQSCPTLCNPMDCSLPSPSVHGILQANILEWVATSFSREIFLTQGSNPGLLHCRQILYCLSHPGSPKQINKKDLLYSTGNYNQCLKITYNGKESGKICVTELFFCMPETNRILQINYTSIFKKSTDFPVVQQLRTCLPMHGTWVPSLVREDPTCHRATRPMCSGAHAL